MQLDGYLWTGIRGHLNDINTPMSLHTVQKSTYQQSSHEVQAEAWSPRAGLHLAEP